MKKKNQITGNYHRQFEITLQDKWLSTTVWNSVIILKRTSAVPLSFCIKPIISRRVSVIASWIFVSIRESTDSMKKEEM